MFKIVDSNKDLRQIREIVLYEIRNTIFENKLKSGDRLVQNIIASSMGISRTPSKRGHKTIRN